MAKSRLEADIPGIGSVTVSGNIATEDAIEELIAAVQRLDQSKKVETGNIQNNLDKTTESLEEFDDEVDRATKSQEKLNKQMIQVVDRAESLGRGFTRTMQNTNSMSDMVESAGEVLAGFAGGVAGFIPFIGQGAARLAEATVMAGTALLSMAVGAVESFQAMNRSIMDGGLLLQGGFSGLADAADIAGIPVNEFGEAVMANISRLRLLEGGAPGGIRRLSAGFKVLQEAQDENLDSLYALGFSQRDVVAGMADVALGAQRAGRNLSSEELAAGTYDYLRNLRELNKLTAQSAESIQSQVDANRNNMFIQRGLAGLGGEQRAAAEDFVAAMQQAGAGGLAAYALTGEISSAQQGLAVEQNRVFADIMRQYFVDLQNGVDPATAMSRYQESMAANQELISAQADANNRMFGQTLELADQFSEIGAINRLAIEQARAALLGEDPLGELDGNNLSITMGALQGAGEAARAAIQSTFVEGLDELSGDTGALTRFAESMSGAAMGAEAFRDAVFAAMQGDFEAAASALGVGPGERGSLSEENYVPGVADEFGSLSPDQTGAGTGTATDGIVVGTSNATGGIVSGPDAGFLGELHGTEAIVPLPDGETIPVTLNSSGSNRSLSELVSISRNMLSQMTATAQRMESMVKAMEQSNNINRTAAYVRA